MRIRLQDTGDTMKLGYNLASLLGPGDIVILSGELGSGKTTLAQGLAKALGVRNRVNSPSFTIIHEYQGRCPFYHIDVYRLPEPSPAEELGLEEYFYGRGVTAVEWGERLAGLLPPEYLKIELEYDGEGGRFATLTPLGRRYFHIVEELKKIVGTGG